MRKLLLFGLLGSIFGSALLLEHLFSRGGEPTKRPANKAVLLVGGGAPRRIDDGETLQVVEDEPIANARGKGRTPAADPRREKPSPEPEPDARTRKVAARDTLWTIASAELGSGARYKDLAAWNGLDADAPLKVGTTLRLSPPGALASTETPKKAPVADAPAPPRAAAADAPRTHKVAKGETLSKIAARYLGDAGRWREIQSLNRIADPAAVIEGSVLSLPER